MVRPPALMHDSMMTANDYMIRAKHDIDELFGEGFAKKHPDLLAAYMKTASIDYLANYWLGDISKSLSRIADGLDKHAPELPRQDD